MSSRYQLIRKLATGGMAEVFLAKVAGPGGFEKTMVLKKILPQLAERASFVEMFLAEARIAAQLAHPNIVQIFDFGEEDGGYYIAMEYLDGINLRVLSRWAQGANDPIPTGVAARILAMACEGLAWAHDFVNPETGQPLGLIHRDMSADNIMVARSGTVKLLDFGIAHVEGSERTRAGQLKGKVAYMPVEQLRADPLDKRIDIYALGVVLYHLLTGHRPFERPNEIALITAILSEQPTPISRFRPDLPAELVGIIEKATARERDDRYPDCHAMQAALEAFIFHQGEQIGSAQIAQVVGKAMSSSLASSAAQSVSGGSGASAVGLAKAGKSSVSKVSLSALEDHTPATGKSRTPSMPALPAVPPPLPSAPPPLPSQPTRPSQISMPAVAPVSPAAGIPWPPPAVPSASPTPPVPPPTTATGRHTAVPQPPQPSGLAAATRTITHAPIVVAPGAILSALRNAALTDRSIHLLRKFPPVAARLTDVAPDLTPPIQEALSGVIDAALLAEEHGMLARLLERALARADGRGKFGALLCAELGSTQRMCWLVERLRTGLPVNVEALQAWLVRLGPAIAPMLLSAIDALEPGPGQDLICKALGTLVASDPAVIVVRLEEPHPRNVSAMCCVLEAGMAADRGRVFQRLLGRRDPALTMQVMTGRARARGPDMLMPLEAALGDRAEEIRAHALKLLGDLEDHRATQLLLSRLADPDLERRSDAERTATWAAAFATRDPKAFALAAEVLDAKTTLLNRKKSIAGKLIVVAGLARSGQEEARALLDRLVKDRSHPDEVLAAARTALSPKPAPIPERPPLEQRFRLRRAFVLDLLAISRAMGAVDIAGGVLDVALSRLQDEIRELVTQEGKLELSIGPDGASINGAPVHLTFHGVELGGLVARILATRDLRTFAVAGPIQVSELRTYLLQQFDPAGTTAKAPHVKATTFSGRVLAPRQEPPQPADPRARASEMYRTALDFLLAQREGIRAGRLPAVTQADSFLDQWARLYASGAARLLSVVPPRVGDEAFAVHAANTAIIGMAFGADLKLDLEPLRQIAEVALFWTMVETDLPASRLAEPGAASPDEVRLRLSGLFMAQLKNRRAPSYAVAAIEAGLDLQGDASRGAGIVASIVALAEAWDSLAVKAGLGHTRALEQLEKRFSRRFSPELFKLFQRWGAAQIAGQGS